jgi:hypothetical protein
MSTVVVLNKDYKFLCEVCIQKALKWVVQNKVEIIAFKPKKHKTLQIKIPLVIRLKKLMKLKKNDLVLRNYSYVHDQGCYLIKELEDILCTEFTEQAVEAIHSKMQLVAFHTPKEKKQ